MFSAIDDAWDKHRVDQLIAGYQDVENKVLRKVASQVKRSLRDPSSIASVPVQDLASLRRLRQPPIAQMMREVEARVRASAQRDLGQSTRSDSRISTETADRINAEIGRARNTASALYRRALSEALSEALGDPTGVQAQRALNRIADTGLRTTGGRESLVGFTRRSLRTALSNTAIQTYMNVMADNGHDLVVVSDESAECPMCRPFEGKILSVTGSTPGKTSIDSARSAGLFHPHCRHSISAYTGQARPKDTEDPEGNSRQEGDAADERRRDKLIRRDSVAL
jgi:hypothetical protein